MITALATGAPTGMWSKTYSNLARGCHRERIDSVAREGGSGEETTTLGNRCEMTRQATPCTSLAPDFPISPGKMRPSFYPTA
jgi:hypothetical protein